MSTTYQELYQKVQLRLNNSGGRAHIFAKEGVNDAHKWIARVKDFDELMTWDISGTPATVASQESYHLVDDWSLTRPKDVYSLVYYTGDSSSRKLTWRDAQEFDEMYPYPGVMGEQDPWIYTQKGEKVYLSPIPEEEKIVRVYYSQWPLVLSADSDQTSYKDIDDVLIALAYDIAKSALTGVGVTDWTKRAAALLAGGIREHSVKPDQRYVAHPFRASRGRVMGEYWLNPMIKENP
jgi:hypothetical protein